MEARPNLRVAALLVAAGSGVRINSAVPKQFSPILGKPMLCHSFGSLRRHPAITQVIVVIAVGQHEAMTAALGEVEHVFGGSTRRGSVAAGLAALAVDPPDVVLIHDAARPFLPAQVIDRILAPLVTYDGAVPGVPLADTLARSEAGGSARLMGAVVARDHLFRIQTPQAFRFGSISAAHRDWQGDDPTDDAQMVRAAGGSVALVAGDDRLDKITYPGDFAAAEARGSSMRVRTAMGFDVHRLETGEQLWLGGIRIAHDRGLSGHSDADVALHALTDALLGTIADGDIGAHFPPSDEQWRGASSARFLEHAAALINVQGGVVDFVDLTLICEAPRIGPHRQAMRARIAALLRLRIDQVSVKATTSERLGFAGRGEGIAAQAVATVRIPEEI